MHSDNQCALFMIDTDNFKQINDTKGHMLGDVVLTEMASGMKKLMRESDIVGRIGGDEFAIFMKNIPSSQAAEKRAGELSEMFAHLFEDEKQEVQVTCSIGIALSRRMERILIPYTGVRTMLFIRQKSREKADTYCITKRNLSVWMKQNILF